MAAGNRMPGGEPTCHKKYMSKCLNKNLTSRFEFDNIIDIT